MVTGANGEGSLGDLGRATTPGTGSGIVLANLQASTVRACAELGHALADAYAGVTLPDGSQGNLVFTSNTSGGVAVEPDPEPADPLVIAGLDQPAALLEYGQPGVSVSGNQLKSGTPARPGQVPPALGNRPGSCP
jgi:hypothetical protein